MAKPKELLDAVTTAKSIHDGDYSSLRGKYFVIRDKIKKKKDYHFGDNTVKKSRLDRIEESIAKLAKQINERFDNLEKDFNSKIDGINARLDNVEKRLDYNALQIEQINKRLDYNNLKQLPKR